MRESNQMLAGNCAAAPASADEGDEAVGGSGLNSSEGDMDGWQPTSARRKDGVRSQVGEQ